LHHSQRQQDEDKPITQSDFNLALRSTNGEEVTNPNSDSNSKSFSMNDLCTVAESAEGESTAARLPKTIAKTSPQGLPDLVRKKVSFAPSPAPSRAEEGTITTVPLDPAGAAKATKDLKSAITTL
jgi:hypothetical protein